MRAASPKSTGSIRAIEADARRRRWGLSGRAPIWPWSAWGWSTWGQVSRSAGSVPIEIHADGKLAFCLTGSYREEDLGGGTVLSVGDNPLAFDHAQIVAQAFLRMLSFDTKKLVFFFLPEKFTLSNYIDVYQYFTHNAVSAANIPSFRRQLTATREPLLEVCGDEMEDLGGRAHAPARLYRRRITA